MQTIKSGHVHIKKKYEAKQINLLILFIKNYFS